MRILKLVVLASALAACSKHGGKGDSTDDSGTSAAAEKQVLTDTVNVVIIPTYQDLSKQADALLAAVNTFDKARTEANLGLVRDAWKATRSPWEQNEGFLFGPVESFGFDEAIDSWPLDITDIKAVLDTDVASITNEAIAAADKNRKGFHAAELLIWGEGAASNPKKATDFKAQDIAYLKATANGISSIGTQLAAAWATGIEGKAAFKDTFTSAGEVDNTTFPSRSVAFQTLVDKMAGICKEVGTSKINNPLTKGRDANLVESQFSYNSLTDFANNIRSVQNIYTGSYPSTGKSGASFSSVISAKNADLDTRVRAAITATITAIQAIPEPFPKAIANAANDDVIHAAQKQLADLNTLLTTEVNDAVK